MRAVLGARCCGSLLTAAELDVAVHTAHRELQASLRRARSRLLLRATTSTFDHFEFAFWVSGDLPAAPRRGRCSNRLAAPRAAASPAAPHRPPTRAQRRRRRNRRRLHGVHSYYDDAHHEQHQARTARACQLLLICAGSRTRACRLAPALVEDDNAGQARLTAELVGERLLVSGRRHVRTSGAAVRLSH